MADMLGMGAQRAGSKEGHKLLQGPVLLLVLLRSERVSVRRLVPLRPEERDTCLFPRSVARAGCRRRRWRDKSGCVTSSRAKLSLQTEISALMVEARVLRSRGTSAFGG